MFFHSHLLDFSVSSILSLSLSSFPFVDRTNYIPSLSITLFTNSILVSIIFNPQKITTKMQFKVLSAVAACLLLATPTVAAPRSFAELSIRSVRPLHRLHTNSDLLPVMAQPATRPKKLSRSCRPYQAIYPPYHLTFLTTLRLSGRQLRMLKPLSTLQLALQAETLLQLCRTAKSRTRC